MSVIAYGGEIRLRRVIYLLRKCEGKATQSEVGCRMSDVGGKIKCSPWQQVKITSHSVGDKVRRCFAPSDSDIFCFAKSDIHFFGMSDIRLRRVIYFPSENVKEDKTQVGGRK